MGADGTPIYPLCGSKEVLSMAGKKKEEPLVTLERLRDNLVAVALMVKKRELTPNEGNAMVNAYRGAIYAEQTRIARDKGEPTVFDDTAPKLSRADRERLDSIAKLLSSKEGK